MDPAAWSPRWRVLGIAALFSGAALLAFLLFDLPLRFALAVTTTMLALAVAVAWRRASRDQRSVIVRTAAVGAIAGIAATVVYDTSRWALSQLDASPYQPFEAIRAFGYLLGGPAVTTTTATAVGTAFHALNGTAFGVAFAFLFGDRGVVAGMVWGLFLEGFQITLYPGWLDIEAYREFVQISAAGHLAYGATLGLLWKLGRDRYGLAAPRRRPLRSGAR